MQIYVNIVIKVYVQRQYIKKIANVFIFITRPLSASLSLEGGHCLRLLNAQQQLRVDPVLPWEICRPQNAQSVVFFHQSRDRDTP